MVQKFHIDISITLAATTGCAKYIFRSFSSISLQPRGIFSFEKRHQKGIKITFLKDLQLLDYIYSYPQNWQKTVFNTFFESFSWIKFSPVWTNEI